MAKRVTQVVALVPYQGDPEMRITQVVALVPYQGDPEMRITQVVALVAYPIIAAPAPARPLGRSYVIG